MTSHVVIVGAGIVGLATAYELSRRGHRVTVLEKEDRPATHQTGRNSGVIHSGLYYTPGSLKATLGTAGARSMREFAEEHGVAHDICGKLVVATRESQLPALRKLAERGAANGVPLRMLTPAEARAYEPEAACVAALRVETTGIVDYVGVCEVLAKGVNGEVITGAEVTGVHAEARGITVSTTRGDVPGTHLVNCAGLHADRVARLAGLSPDVRIVPFRGEYFELIEAQEHLVRGLIYPVPDPTLPFLGVHLTRTTHGTVHAGPNAVLALAREGYDWRTVKGRDLADSVRWPGLWRLGRKHWRTGITEVRRSLSRRRFLASLRELVPALSDDALVSAPAGVRAQAVRRDGGLADDFIIERAERQVHVLNAPSPAATASLEIGRRVAGEIGR